MQYWLMKSEPEAFSIDDLAQRPEQTEPWDGVRNYQARNMMRDNFALGDQVFFYHSNCQEPGIVGLAKVVKTGYPDDTALDSNHKHYDPKSTLEKPIWYRVDIQFVRKLARTISLKELKTYTELTELALIRRGNRLSIMPVTAQQWEFILGLE